ncbi:hypothetical protein, partial [Enterococcus faecium]|uniref:hypothetical protein n=1 Tax=Enterococcus faecium TaxID=1352 RepID=UPI003F444BB1
TDARVHVLRRANYPIVSTIIQMMTWRFSAFELHMVHRKRLSLDLKVVGHPHWHIVPVDADEFITIF